MAGLYLLAGLILLLVAGSFRVLGVPLPGSLSLIAIGLGILAFVTAVGLWLGAKPFWHITFIGSVAQILSIISLSFYSFIVGTIIAYYLWKPDMKDYFGIANKGFSAPIIASIAVAVLLTLSSIIFMSGFALFLVMLPQSSAQVMGAHKAQVGSQATSAFMITTRYMRMEL